MSLLLIYSCVLLCAVLISSLAARSMLSTSVLFLIAGFLAGPEMLHGIDVSPEQKHLTLLVQLALFSVLFTDGMHVGWSDLRAVWHLPGRALTLGMPLTLLLTAVAARLLLGTTWMQAALLGAILSPTDPVFASAIVGRDEISLPLRHLLNVESGVNDGLALPLVVVFLSTLEGSIAGPFSALAELLGGVAIGVTISYAALKLEQSHYFAASAEYKPLNAVAIGLIVLATAKILHGNLYLAAFAAGMTMATVGPETREAFHRFGYLIVELLKLLALLLFGALISPRWLTDFPALGYVFVIVALVLVRPLAVGLAMLGSSLPLRERAVAAWFGPKGFASMAYGLLLYHSNVADRVDLFHWIAITVAISNIAHSSTDVAIARWLSRDKKEPVTRYDDARNVERRGQDQSAKTSSNSHISGRGAPKCAPPHEHTEHHRVTGHPHRYAENP